MGIFIIILVVGAFAVFVLATFNVPSDRVGLVPLGLALLTLAYICGAGPGLLR